MCEMVSQGLNCCRCSSRFANSESKMGSEPDEGFAVSGAVASASATMLRDVRLGDVVKVWMGETIRVAIAARVESRSAPIPAAELSGGAMPLRVDHFHGRANPRQTETCTQWSPDYDTGPTT